MKKTLLFACAIFAVIDFCSCNEPKKDSDANSNVVINEPKKDSDANSNVVIIEDAKVPDGILAFEPADPTKGIQMFINEEKKADGKDLLFYRRGEKLGNHQRHDSASIRPEE